MGTNGRPTEYVKKYDRMAYRHCLLGATDKDLAELFEVSEQTINAWKHEHPIFLESIKKGKVEADQAVTVSLYKRATGYSHPDTHISNYLGVVTKTAIRKHYPPDTTACIFWLKNRQKANWRDKIDHEVTGKDGGPVEVKVVPDAIMEMIKGTNDQD